MSLCKIPSRQIDLEKSLAEAAKHVEECDGIVIIMQRKNPLGGFYYFANSGMRLETMIWYLTSLQFQIHTTAAGSEDAL
jgi:hypothetical protein